MADQVRDDTLFGKIERLVWTWAPVGVAMLLCCVAWLLAWVALG